MNEMSVRAQTVYQSTRDVNVVNNFTPDANNFMAWIIAMARCSRDSVIVFDKSKQIIYMNNAWGTFDDCLSIKTLSDMLIRVNSIYHNPGQLKTAIEHTFRFAEARNFVLHMVDGTDAICRSYPVIDHGFLTGTILTAWKDSNTIRQETSTYTIGS